MRKLNRLTMTLALLITAVGGAWATDETPLLTIESKDYTSFKSGSKTFDDMVTVTFSNSVDNNGNEWGWYSTGASLLTVAGTNGYTITSCKFYTYNGPAKTGYTVEGESPSVYIYNGNVYTDDSKSVSIGTFGVTKIEVYTGAASSGTTVTFTRGTGDDSNKWTMDNGMPAGNVEVAPEYYPQATVATGGVTAATGVQATTDAELVTIDATKLTGATTLKYIVTTDATPAPAYDATGWTSDIPTAANITTVGLTYVWYYPVGTDDEDPAKTYSDGDICKEPISVSIQPAPTYAITLAEDTEEADKWTISPAEAIKGTTITVTYTGQKKILGVKAEKKAGTPKVGQIIGSDGKNYDANATLPSGVTAVAMIAYVGSETGVDGYTHGLALALADESSKMNWSTAAGASGAAAHTPAAPTTITSSWMLPSKDQWNKMIEACKNVLGTKNNYQDLRDGFSGIAGASNLQSDFYWSSTESESGCARDYRFDKGGDWYNESKDYKDRVRACLAF